MRNFLTVIVIYLVSELVGLLITPPDPLSHWLYTGTIFLVAISAYFYGRFENRREKTAAEKTA
jgi:Sec-independent protein secretion pathway component TatC